MRFVDTNVFLRFLAGDDPEKATDCEKLFKKTVAGEEFLFTTDMVIAEIVWVLESYYELSRGEVRDNVEKILNTKNLNCPNKDLLFHSLAVYEEKNIDFIDAYNAHIAKMNKISELYSYDAHYDRITWLKRIEPGA